MPDHARHRHQTVRPGDPLLDRQAGLALRQLAEDLDTTPSRAFAGALKWFLSLSADEQARIVNDHHQET
jgi:hypothetical protein